MPAEGENWYTSNWTPARVDHRASWAQVGPGENRKSTSSVQDPGSIRRQNEKQMSRRICLNWQVVVPDVLRNVCLPPCLGGGPKAQDLEKNLRSSLELKFDDSFTLLIALSLWLTFI